MMTTMKITYSKVMMALALIFVADLMLLPMFHPFGISFKPSYLILLALPFIFVPDNLKTKYADVGRRRRLWIMTSPIIGIALVGFLGQLYLMNLGDVLDPGEAIKQITVYVLMVLAFGFGQFVPQFQLRWILWILYALIAIILLLSLAGDYVPMLAKLWWHSDEIIAKRLIQNELRPTPFGDGSMVGANILFLCLIVSARLGYVKIRKYHVVLSTALILFTCFILGSRNQMVVSIMLGIAFALAGTANRIRKFCFLVALFIGIVTFVILFSDVIRDRFSFINNSYSRIERTKLFDTTTERKTHTILRPLLHWDRFKDRYLASPLIGSGFSLLNYYPFEYIHFHNDWFYVFATSGAIGGGLLFLWMFRIYRVLGLLVLLPFFLPGLTNSFLGAISPVIVYCFMLGVLIERKALIKAGYGTAFK